MNFEKYANKLEVFLEEELTSSIPLLVLNDNSILYKRFKIKKTKNDFWALSFLNGDIIEKFRLKASASIAAKCYDKGEFSKFNEIKVLDSQYWQNAMDTFIFNHRLKTTTDLEKYDIATARLDVAKDREQYYRKKISSMFRTSFDK